MTSLSKRLNHLRKKKQHNQKEETKLHGITNTSLNGYENKVRTPNLEILYKLADFYNVCPAYLLFGENKNYLDFFSDVTEEEAVLLKEYLETLREKDKTNKE